MKMNWNRLQSSSPQTRARHPEQASVRAREGVSVPALRVQATRHAVSNWNDNTNQRQRTPKAARRLPAATATQQRADDAAAAAVATQQSSALLAQLKQRVKYFRHTNTRANTKAHEQRKKKIHDQEKNNNDKSDRQNCKALKAALLAASLNECSTTETHTHTHTYTRRDGSMRAGRDSSRAAAAQIRNQNTWLA